MCLNGIYASYFALTRLLRLACIMLSFGFDNRCGVEPHKRCSSLSLYYVGARFKLLNL